MGRITIPASGSYICIQYIRGFYDRGKNFRQFGQIVHIVLSLRPPKQQSQIFFCVNPYFIVNSSYLAMGLAVLVCGRIIFFFFIFKKASVFMKTNLVIYFLVVHLGDVNKLKLMEARGADMNSVDYDGRSALHIAASQGQ